MKPAGSKRKVKLKTVSLGKAPTATQLEIARSYRKSGLSIIPIRANGSKQALVAWKQFQSRLSTVRELQKWFERARTVGIGIVCGKVSGNLEILDFDDADAFVAWTKLVPKRILKRLPQVKTPAGGRHVYYRCKVIEGNQKLAQTQDQETLIETRGEGGYCLAPGSSPSCHECGSTYRLVAGPTLSDIPTITEAERDVLIGSGRQLNLCPVVIRGLQERSSYAGRPGDAFNRRATWNEILEPHGWSAVDEKGSERFWRRPGKGNSHSATTGFCVDGETDLFYVFSSNAEPFKAGQAYPKFAAYALLNHGGDFKAAAKQLSSADYGQDSDSQAIMRPLSEIEARPIDWIWPGMLALGKLTIMSGHPGRGKSLISVDIAARITTGSSFPLEEQKRQPATVIALSAEDDAADTIRPRFDRAGGDATRLILIEGTRRKGRDSYFDLEKDIGALSRALEAISDCRLVIIDPLSAYMGNIDAHRNTEVRQLLRPLADLASKKRVAILLIDHLNKSETGSAVTRSQGSIAFVAASRIALLVAEHPTDSTRRVLLPLKNNLHSDQTGYGYRITDGPRLVWDNERATMSAQDLLGPASAPKTSPRSDAKAWLSTILGRGPTKQEDVRTLAEIAGHTWATIRRAKDELRIASRKGKGSKTAGFVWSLSSDDPVEQVEHIEQVDEPARSKPKPSSRSSTCSTRSGVANDARSRSGRRAK